MISKTEFRPSFPLEIIPIEMLDYDLRNSRFPRDAKNQHDAFKLMLTTAGDGCLELLKDIAKTGTLNSSDLPIAIRNKGRYTMMEGNRRLTCLKIWSNPDLLLTDEILKNKYYTRIKQIIEASTYSPPREIQVVVAPSENEAEPWIDKKHSSGAGGAGTVEWGPAMKDRRQSRNDPSKKSKALAFIELISDEYSEHPEIISALESVRTTRYSLIQRFINSKIVRKKLGIEYSDGKMSFPADSKKHLSIIIGKILLDFANPKADSGRSWSRELNTTEDFENYLNKYQELMPQESFSTENRKEPSTQDVSKNPSGDKSKKNIRNGNKKDDKFTSADNDDLNDARPPRPNPSHKYIFKEINLNHFTPRIQRIVQQTSRLNINQHNETTSVMLRVILDLTTHHFLETVREECIPVKLDKKIKAVIKVIDPSVQNSPIGTAEKTSDLLKIWHYTDKNTIGLTQYAVHDKNNSSTPNEVLALADRYTPLLITMNTYLGTAISE